MQFDDIDESGYYAEALRWAVEAITFCKLNNIMQGDDLGMFRPAEPVTRAEAAAVVQRTAENLAAMN